MVNLDTVPHNMFSLPLLAINTILAQIKINIKIAYYESWNRNT